MQSLNISVVFDSDVFYVFVYLLYCVLWFFSLMFSFSIITIIIIFSIITCRVLTSEG